MIFVLTGEIDSGKSTAVANLCRDLIAKGYTLSGLITTAHMIDGRKVGHDCVFIKNNRLRDPVVYTRLSPFPRSSQWRRYHFNTDVFSDSGTLRTDCDLFVIDEIGPLELEHREGFLLLLERLLRQEPPPPLLIVARKQSLDALKSLLAVEDLDILGSAPDLSRVKYFLRKQRS